MSIQSFNINENVTIEYDPVVLASKVSGHSPITKVLPWNRKLFVTLYEKFKSMVIFAISSDETAEEIVKANVSLTKDGLLNRNSNNILVSNGIITLFKNMGNYHYAKELCLRVKVNSPSHGSIIIDEVSVRV